MAVMKTTGSGFPASTSTRSVAPEALPSLIPPGEEHGEEILSIVDGVILAGGGDIDPALYGGTKHETIYSVDAERDQSEMALARHLAGSSVPTLGICRGHQVINVALGGSLYEHLPEVVGDRVIHRLAAARSDSAPHRGRRGIADGVTLGRDVVRRRLVASPGDPHARQRPVGRRAAPDGTIEGCEMHSHPWFFSVQWHPELTAHASPTQQRLFDSLVEACRQRIARDGRS